MSHTANWKLRSTDTYVWKYEGNTRVPRENPNADFENTMIAHKGDTLIDDCFGFVKVIGQYENGSLLIRKNDGDGEELARTEGHVKASYSNQLVADRKKHFKELAAALASDDGDDSEDGEAPEGEQEVAGADNAGGADMRGGNTTKDTAGQGQAGAQVIAMAIACAVAMHAACHMHCICRCR